MLLLTVSTAIVALPLLLYLPGLLLSRVLLPCTDALACHFERVVISALLSGWLALVLASFGIFSLWLQLGLLMLLCGALLPLAYRRPSPAPQVRSLPELLAFAGVGLVALVLVLPPSQAILGARDASVYANTGFAIARTGSLVQHDELLAEMARHAQSSDPALRGAAEQAMTNFLGSQNPERFIATSLYTAGFFIHEGDATQGRIVPQHLHLPSAWIGLLTSVLGYSGGLFATGLLGVLGAWCVGMLGRRLVNGWVGALAFLLLALNSVQVWFARYPTSETTAQFLIFAGLYFFARFQVPDQQPQSTADRRALVTYAALTGVAFGQLALARIEAFLIIAPLLLYLLYCLLTHRWRSGQTAIALSLGALLLHTALHIAFIARAYFFDTAFARLQDYAITSYLAQPFITPLLREVYHTTNRSPFKDPLLIWHELAVLLVVVLALLALWRWPQPLRFAEHWLRRGRAWLAAGAAVLVVLLASYAYVVRPQTLSPALLVEAPRCLLPQNWQLSASAVQAAPPSQNTPLTQTTALSETAALPAAAPAPRDPCLTLQGYVGAPIELPPPPEGLDEKYTIPLANFVRFGWYLSPLGIVLGVLGFAWWFWRGLNRASWLFLVVGFLGTFFFVRDTYGTSDQTYIYILRRFVSVAYPAFSLSIAFALVGLAPAKLAGLWSWLRAALAGGLALLLVAFFVWTGRPIYQHVEYDGAIEQIGQLAARFDPNDVLLLRGGAPDYHQYRDVPDLIATPLRFAFGRNALPVKSSQPAAYADALASQVRHWQAQGREVYLLLSASGGSFALPGFALEPVGSFRLQVPEFEQLTDQKPRNVAPLHLAFEIYRLVDGPAQQLATLDMPLQADDFAAQVQGFYLPEYQQDSPDQPYAWTTGSALLRIPWPPDLYTSELVLQAAGGQRPAHLGPARVCVSLRPETLPWSDPATAFVPLDCIDLQPTMQRYRLSLNADQIPATPARSALVRLESSPWVPAQEDTARHDQRTLGIQFGGLRSGKP